MWWVMRGRGKHGNASTFNPHVYYETTSKYALHSPAGDTWGTQWDGPERGSTILHGWVDPAYTNLGRCALFSHFSVTATPQCHNTFTAYKLHNVSVEIP